MDGEKEAQRVGASGLWSDGRRWLRWAVNVSQSDTRPGFCTLFTAVWDSPGTLPAGELWALFWVSQGGWEEH